MASVNVQSVVRDGDNVLITGTVDGAPVSLSVPRAALETLAGSPARLAYCARQLKDQLDRGAPAPLPAISGTVTVP